MAKRPRVYLDHKALSAFGPSLPRVIQTSFNYSSPVISGNIHRIVLKRGMLRSIALKALAG